MQSQKGFTLIELMIVVAIVATLAVVAIPQYQDYMIRTKVSTALMAVAPLKTAIGLCSQENGGTLNNCNTTTEGKITSVPRFTPVKEVKSAEVSEGVIRLVLADGIGQNIDGKQIVITPEVSPDSTAIVWKLSSDIDHDSVQMILERSNLTSDSDSSGNS